jgi:hypothetical protein
VTWQSPLNNGGSAVTRYDIYPGYYGGAGFEPEISKHVNGRTNKVVFTHMDHWVDWVFSVAATNAKSQSLPSRLQVETDPSYRLSGQMLVESWLDVISAPGQWAYRHGFGDLWANTPRMGVDTVYWKGPVPALIRELIAAIPKHGPFNFAPSRYTMAEAEAAANAMDPIRLIHTASGVMVTLTSWGPDPVHHGVWVTYWPANQPDNYQGPFPPTGQVETVLRMLTRNGVDVYAEVMPPVTLT